jgi:hypothetical protein
LALNLVKEKGIFGLYRGLGPTMARDVTFSMIYFPLFASLDSFVWVSIFIVYMVGWNFRDLERLMVVGMQFSTHLFWLEFPLERLLHFLSLLWM